VEPSEYLSVADQSLLSSGESAQATLSQFSFMDDALFDPLQAFEAPVRGASAFEELAMQHDTWNKITKHFDGISTGKRESRAADIALMAQRLKADPEELASMMNWASENRLISPMKIDLGVAELFFRRQGYAKGKANFAEIQALIDNPNSRLSAFEKQKLGASLFRDLAVPAMIGQGGKGSCAAAAMHVMLASKDPQQFLEMTLKLAEGKSYTLPDGQTLKPNDDWRDGNREDRQLSEAVVQNALMDLMLGQGKYHSFLDEGANQPAPSAGQQRRGLERLSGDKLDYDNTSTIMIWPASTLTASNGMSALEDELVRGRPVVVNIWGHAMAVVGMDKTGPETKVLVSTYGSQIEMPAKGLERYLMHSITVDDPGRDNWKVPTGQRIVIGTDMGRLPR